MMFLFPLQRSSFLLLFILMVLLPLSCGKDSRHPVPDVYLDFPPINIESTQYLELNSIGGWAYFTGGFKGVIIYRVSYDEFRAFDRACPYHPFEECAIVRVTDPPLATDTCCGSTFLLLDGSPVEGPSRHPLKQYQTSFNYPYLSVTN